MSEPGEKKNPASLSPYRVVTTSVYGMLRLSSRRKSYTLPLHGSTQDFAKFRRWQIAENWEMHVGCLDAWQRGRGRHIWTSPTWYAWVWSAYSTGKSLSCVIIGYRVIKLSSVIVQTTIRTDLASALRHIYVHCRIIRHYCNTFIDIHVLVGYEL